MKKLLTVPLIMLGACAACCAMPLLAPLLAGLLTAGIGAAFGGWQIGMAVAIIIVGLALVQVVRSQTRNIPTDDPCQVACKSPPNAGPCGCHATPHD